MRETQIRMKSQSAPTPHQKTRGLKQNVSPSTTSPEHKYETEQEPNYGEFWAEMEIETLSCIINNAP